ncbi:hypothetical protein CKO24_08530 [Rhodothalassium salexigens DSM 2132]|nr:hypothetical protein [Rhodothalassium salexigens DSM 2132]
MWPRPARSSWPTTRARTNLSIKVTAEPVKFTFDERFGEAPAEEEVDHAAAEIDRLRRQVDEAHRSGYAEGLEAGRGEGQQAAVSGLEAQIAQTVDAVSRALAHLLHQHAQVVERLEMGAVQLGHRLARAMAPAALERFADAAVEDVLTQAVRDARDAPALTLFVAPDLVEPVRERLSDVIEGLGYTGQVSLAGDGTLATGDARVEWHNGGAEFSSDRLAKAVDDAVHSLLRSIDGADDQGPVTGHSAADAPAADGAPGDTTTPDGTSAGRPDKT